LRWSFLLRGYFHNIVGMAAVQSCRAIGYESGETLSINAVAFSRKLRRESWPEISECLDRSARARAGLADVAFATIGVINAATFLHH
jgi:hypothetical protein